MASIGVGGGGVEAATVVVKALTDLPLDVFGKLVDGG